MIHFYSSDTNSKSIIAYGDIDRKRVFKITYSGERYFAHKLQKTKYWQIGVASNLAEAQNLCTISIQKNARKF